MGGFIILIVLISPAAALIATALSIPQTPTPLRGTPEVESALVRSVLDLDVQNISLEVTPGQRPVMRAPTWEGLVTEVNVSVGDSIVDGTVLARVGGTASVAVRTPVPFARGLSPGAVGTDVTSLQTVLTQFGFYSGPIDGRYGRTTGTAVKAWRTSVNDLLPNTDFSTAMVVWIPVESLRVEETQLTAADVAPPAGTVIVRGAPSEYETFLADENGAPLDSIAPGYELLVGERSFGLIGADGPSREQIVAILDEATPAVSPRKPAGPTEAETSDVIKISARLQRLDPARRTQVPAGSVVSDLGDSSTCLFLLEAGGFTPFVTSVVGGELGLVFVDPAPADGTEIVANPSDVAQGRKCT